MSSDIKIKVQSFGRFLSNMVMPNIGAFIAWGIITALFIPTGWLPNETLAKLVGPMITYLLPLLIGYTGGKLVGGERGGVVGAITTMGVIVGADMPMFLGSMIAGPLGGWCIKHFDRWVDGKIKSGFEMLVNNFSAGIIGMILAILAFLGIGPIVEALSKMLAAGVNFMVVHDMLPLASIFVEPAKILFLNNAINHGIFSPLGIQQSHELGKSIFFLIEANPGPGMGVLLAYMFFGRGSAKQSAGGAAIIHFLGGIHEIYFPYILMNPVVIIAPIVGNICAITFYTITGAGLVGPSSPGSIIAFMSMSPKGMGMVITFLGVAIAATVSFLIASPIVKMADHKSLEDAQAKKDSMKAEAKGLTTVSGADVQAKDIKKIVFACDAGMGSSAMGATKFRNRIKDLNLGITVTNTSVDNVPADANVVVCQEILKDRAAKSAPQARLITLENFLADPHLDALYAELETLTTGKTAEADKAEAPAEEKKETKAGILVPEGIKTGCASVDKETAIRAAGQLLCDLGYVDANYIDAMVEREKIVTTYMGMGVAIPHGTSDAKETVKKSGIVVMQYPDGVQFGNEKANLIIGIAGVGDEHLEILANIAGSLEDEALLENLKKNADADTIMKTFG